MEFYTQLFEPVLPHFKEHLMLYIIGIPLLIGIIFLTRRYSVPIIVFAIELIVYSSAMHATVHVAVRVFSWFKNTSSMKMIRDPDDYVEWATPLLRFWELEVYQPEWVIMLEVGLLITILALMYRFQPLKPQYLHKSRYQKSPPQPGTSSDADDWGSPKKFPAQIKPTASKTRKRR